MSMYLVQFTLTPATWGAMLKKPEDRSKAIAPLYEALGGKLHGFWYTFSGDGHGYVLGELPMTSRRRARSPWCTHPAPSPR